MVNLGKMKINVTIMMKSPMNLRKLSPQLLTVKWKLEKKLKHGFLA